MDEAPKFLASFLSLFWRRLDVCFFWLLSHVLSGHLSEDSVLEGPLEAFEMSPTFSEEAPKWSESFLNCFCASWLGLYHPTYSGVFTLVYSSDIFGDLRSALVVGSSTARLLVWQRFFQAIDRPKVTNLLGAPKRLERLLRYRECCPWKYDSFLMLFSS